MATVDRLDIQIEGSAKKANEAIDSLITNLNKLANSLKIDTSNLEKIGKSLNINGIDKSAKSMQSQMQKVSKSLSQITEQYKDLGKGFEIKGSTQQIQKQINSLTNQLAKAKLAKEDFEMSEKTNLGGYETAVKNVIKYTNQIESLKKQLSEMQSTQPKIDLDVSGMEGRKKYIIEYKKELIDFKKDIQSISDTYGGLKNAPKGTFDTPIENLKISIQELKRDYPQATEVIAMFEKEFQRLKEISSKLTKEPTRPKIDTSSLSGVNERITELAKRFENLGKDFKFTGNFEQLNIEIEKAYSKLQELGLKEQEMLSAGKINTSDFEKLQASLTETGNKLDVMENLRDRTEMFNQSLKNLVVPPIHEENLTKLQNALRKTEEDTEKLKAKLYNLTITGKIIPNIDNSTFKDLTIKISESEKYAEALRKKIQEVGSQSNTASSSTNVLGKNIKNLSSSMRGLGTSAGKAITGMKSFARQALASMGIYLGVFGMVRGLKNSIMNSMNYIENLNYFNAAFGQVAEKADYSKFEEMGYDSAEAYYNSFSKRAEELTAKMTGFSIGKSGRLEATGMQNLGINPTTLMNYQATFAQMSSSMGTTSENALLLSDVLTKIGADLASVKNMDFEKVWNDMASGLAGMSRTLDKYGANIRNVNLQQKLNELGINANISALNQNDKALLRTIILLDSTKYAWGDLSRTLDQPANQLRLLKSNFSNLGRSIGNIFLPIFSKVIPYVNAAVIALQRLADWLVKVFGFEGFEWGGIGNASFDISQIYDDAENLSDGFDTATDKAKELKNELMGFDEINKLSDDTDSTSANSALGIGNGILDEALKKSVSEYQKAWDKAFEGVENRSQKFADNIENAFKKLAAVAKPTSEALKKLWNNGLKKFEKFSITALEDFYSDFLIPIGKWTLGEGLPRLIDVFDNFLNSINWDRINNTLKKLWDILRPFAKGVGKGLIDFLDGYSKIQVALINGVTIAIGKILDIIGLAPANAIEDFGVAIGSLLGAFLVYKSITGAYSVISKIKTAFSGLMLAISSHPYVAIAAGIAAVGIAINNFLKNENSVKIKSLSEETQKIVDNLSESTGKFESTMSNIQGQYDYISQVAEDYIELSQNYSNLTEEQKRLLTTYADILKDNVEGVEKYIDPITGAYQGTRDELMGLIEDTKKYYLTLAAKEQMQEIGKNLAVAKLEATKYGKELNKILNEPLENAKKGTVFYYNSYLEWVESVWSNDDENLQDAIFALETVNYNYNALTKNQKEIVDLARKNDGAFKTYTDAIFDTAYAYGEVTKQIKDSEKELNEWEEMLETGGEAAEEYSSKSVSEIDKVVTKSNELKTINPEVKINADGSKAIEESKKTVKIIDEKISETKTAELKINTEKPLGSVFGFINSVNESFSLIKKPKIDLDLSNLNPTLQNAVGNVQNFLSNALGFTMKMGSFSAITASLSFPKAYATGGFPEDGLFYANHNELVGEFSNGKTVVINNEQIVSGITNAVYQGNRETNLLLTQLITAVNNSEGKTTINIDGKPVFEAVRKRANDYMIQTGKSAFST